MSIFCEGIEINMSEIDIFISSGFGNHEACTEYRISWQPKSCSEDSPGKCNAIDMYLNRREMIAYL